MEFVDPRGLPVSPARASAMERLDAALAALHGYRGDALAEVDALLADEPGFVSARCLRAGLLVLADDRAADRELATELAALDALRAHATARDHAHACAARAWLGGDAHLALQYYGDIVARHPRDLLALQIAHNLDLRLGATESLRDRIAAVLPHWHEGLAGYGCVLSMYAFGLQENAHCEAALHVGRHALELTPGNPGAIHAIAHVHHRRREAAEGLRWLRHTRASWDGNSAFSVHNAWHEALFHLQLEDVDAALAIYDGRIRSAGNSGVSALVDASALLWRIALRRAGLQQRWDELADLWERKVQDQRRIFNNVHALMACAAAGRERSAARIIGLIADRQLQRTVVTADQRLGLPVSMGVHAFCRGQYAEAVQQLTQVRELARRCGGSVAQCDLVELTLREAQARHARRLLQAAPAASLSAA
ncbi:MAG: tetratricopeptide repeat protein [Proteobacteria bacterium]|nr:tetratricopeptide repeat protein [Pseudomonadota bacterium]